MRLGGQVGDGGLSPESSELDLGAIRAALWRRRMFILVPTATVAVVTLLAVNLMTPKYKSEARILIEGRENVFLRPEAEAQAADRSTIDPEAVQSQVQVVLSRDVARKVIKELKLNERPEFDPLVSGLSPLAYILTLTGVTRDPLRMTPEERVLNSYYERLSAFPVDKSRVISVEFTSSDPDLSARVANAIADAYLATQQTARQDQTKQAGDWLSGEIEKLRGKVAEAEARVENFRSSRNLFVGTNNMSLSSQQLTEISSQLSAARAQKADIEAKAQQIRGMLNRGAPLESSDIMNSELMRRLNEQRVTLRAQLAEQSATLLEFHPRIRELRSQIADLELAIRSETERLARSLENDARIASARVDQLNASLTELKRQASDTNEQDVQLRALEREAKAQRDLLEAYLAKYREATARESLTSTPTDARVISRAVVSSTPYFPKKLPTVLIATLAMLVLTSGYVATTELLYGSPDRGPPYDSVAMAPPEELPLSREPLSARLLGSARAPVAAPPTAPAFVSTTEIADLVQVLRRATHAGRRVSVVGGARNVGTTRTAVALGRALARDARTVLIDLALGSPNVGVISSDPKAPGIADLVRGNASFGHIITRDRFSRLHLVTAGKLNGDLAAIVASQRLAITIDALARTYQHVVIDAGALEDTAIEHLARLAPQGVLVATAMPPEMAVSAQQRMLSAGFAGIAVYTGSPPRPDVDIGTRAAA